MVRALTFVFSDPHARDPGFDPHPRQCYFKVIFIIQVIVEGAWKSTFPIPCRIHREICILRSPWKVGINRCNQGQGRIKCTLSINQSITQSIIDSAPLHGCLIKLLPWSTDVKLYLISQSINQSINQYDSEIAVFTLWRRSNKQPISCSFNCVSKSSNRAPAMLNSTQSIHHNCS